MRILLTLQYLGTRYAGWQTQTNAVAVQSVVEEALSRMYGVAIRIEGAGRTDAGVHAAAQRAHFDAPRDIPLRGVMLGANDLLPHDIRVVAAEEVAAEFHCRFEAKSKTYVYRIWHGPALDVFRWETHAHVAGALDVAAMANAAASLPGTHDFRTFTVAEPEVSSTIRTITAAALTTTDGTGSPGADPRASVTSTGHSVELRLTADGFLRYMVRRIAGSLIEIGRGRISPDAIANALEPRFEPARWTAPAKGLVLDEIRY